MKELLARTALVFAATGGYGLAYANIVAPGEHTEDLAFRNLIGCLWRQLHFHCCEMVRKYFERSRSRNGDLVQIRSLLDLTANAKVGAPRKRPTPPTRCPDGKQAGSTANDGAQISSIPNPPNGGTGTVVESLEDRGLGDTDHPRFRQLQAQQRTVQRIYFSCCRDNTGASNAT